MTIYELEREQWIPRPLERVFPFFEKPENLALITPPWLRFRLLCSTPVQMKAGQIIDYRIRIRGVPMGWRTLISTYEPPHQFVDEQVAGPYAYWRHLHQFESAGHKTRILDRVRYAMPRWLRGPSAGVVHSGFVRPTLEEIFNYRAGVFLRMFGFPKQTRSNGGEDE